MSWILLATPIVGVFLVVGAVVSLRYFFPVQRAQHTTADVAANIAERFGQVIAKFVGAAIRDERRRAVETMFEHQTANELNEILRKRA